MHYSPGRRGLQPRTPGRARLQSAPTGFSPRLSPQHTGKGRAYKVPLRGSFRVRAKNDKKRAAYLKIRCPRKRNSLKLTLYLL